MSDQLQSHRDISFWNNFSEAYGDIDEKTDKSRAKSKPQINSEELEAIRKLYSLTKGYFEISKIILFGSRARGDADDIYSDIDLLMLTNKKYSSKDNYKLYDVAADISIKYGIALSCLYITNTDWNSNNINPLLKSNIEKEGIEIVLH